jgi:hypothetical protein
VNTLSSYQGRGGLGNYWHNVIDLGLFDLKNDAEDLKYVFQNISTLNPNLSLSNQEIIPFSSFRPSKLINRYIDRISLTSKCTALKLQNSSIKASFEDRTEIFDRVFICSGALNSSDILVNSDLAEQNENVSDHLIFYEDNVHSLKAKDKDFLTVDRIKGGFSRKYKLFEGFKVTYRPVYSNKKIEFRNKNIFSKTKKQILAKSLNPANYPIMLESLYLRYGLLLPTQFYRRFIQVPLDECYSYKNNLLEVKNEKIDKLITTITNSNFEVSINSCASGIHYFNSIKNLDTNVGNFNSNVDKRILLLSSSYSFNPGPYHFTFKLIVSSYQIIKNIYG